MLIENLGLKPRAFAPERMSMSNQCLNRCSAQRIPIRGRRVTALNVITHYYGQGIERVIAVFN